MKLRVVLLTCLAWLLVAVVRAAQATLVPPPRGGRAPLFVELIDGTFVQTLPWIPVTLAVIALTVRVPFRRDRWIVPALVHVVAAAVLAFFANVLVVLGFWAMMDRYQGPAALARSGLQWATTNFHVALLVYAIVLGVTQAVLYYRRTRATELRLSRAETQLAQARLQALNAQLRPHFLFNALHTIGQLWRTGRSREADEMLDHLGALFHQVQASSSRMEVPLAEELELVRKYLAIEEVRFAGRLRTSIDASRDALRCAVPPLVLQPIVENAVRHGISAVSSAGLVEVNAEVRAGTLVMTVHDDGPGPSAPSPQPGSGTGLGNTRRRLAELFGAKGRLAIGDAPGGGTLVEISIPALQLNGVPEPAPDALAARREEAEVG